MMRTPIKPKKPVSAAELIGFAAYNLIFSLVFGFFALKQDGDPDDGYATADSDTILMRAEEKALLTLRSSEDADAPELINVGERFRFCFLLLFIVHVV